MLDVYRHHHSGAPAGGAGPHRGAAGPSHGHGHHGGSQLAQYLTHAGGGLVPHRGSRGGAGGGGSGFIGGLVGDWTEALMPRHGGGGGGSLLPAGAVGALLGGGGMNIWELSPGKLRTAALAFTFVVTAGYISMLAAGGEGARRGGEGGEGEQGRACAMGDECRETAGGAALRRGDWGGAGVGEGLCVGDVVRAAGDGAAPRCVRQCQL